jgi:hypothetical protein
VGCVSPTSGDGSERPGDRGGRAKHGDVWELMRDTVDEGTTAGDSDMGTVTNQLRKQAMTLVRSHAEKRLTDSGQPRSGLYRSFPDYLVGRWCFLDFMGEDMNVRDR